MANIIIFFHSKFDIIVHEPVAISVFRNLRWLVSSGVVIIHDHRINIFLRLIDKRFVDFHELHSGSNQLIK